MKTRSMEFEFLRPTSREEIPSPHRKSAVSSLPFWPEVEDALKFTREKGAAPFEQAVVIDLAQYKDKLQRNGKPLKRPVMDVLIRLRGMVKKYRLESKLEVVSRGERIFLVGA